MMTKIKCPFCEQEVTEDEVKDHVIKHLGAA